MDFVCCALDQPLMLAAGASEGKERTLKERTLKQVPS